MFAPSVYGHTRGTDDTRRALISWLFENPQPEDRKFLEALAQRGATYDADHPHRLFFLRILAQARPKDEVVQWRLVRALEKVAEGDAENEVRMALMNVRNPKIMSQWAESEMKREKTRIAAINSEHSSLPILERLLSGDPVERGRGLEDCLTRAARPLSRALQFGLVRAFVLEGEEARRHIAHYFALYPSTSPAIQSQLLAMWKLSRDRNGDALFQDAFRKSKIDDKALADELAATARAAATGCREKIGNI